MQPARHGVGRRGQAPSDRATRCSGKPSSGVRTLAGDRLVASTFAIAATKSASSIPRLSTHSTNGEHRAMFVMLSIQTHPLAEIRAHLLTDGTAQALCARGGRVGNGGNRADKPGTPDASGPRTGLQLRRWLPRCASPSSRAWPSARLDVRPDRGRPGQPTWQTRKATAPSGTIRRPDPRRRRTGRRANWMARSPINRTASACVSVKPASTGRGSTCGRMSNRFSSRNAHQDGTGARTLVQRQRADLFDWHAGEQLHRRAPDRGKRYRRRTRSRTRNRERIRSTESAPRPAARPPDRRPGGWERRAPIRPRAPVPRSRR